MKEEEIFSQGSIPKDLFILESGSVVIEHISQSGKRAIVNIFHHPGTVFGEVYLYIEEKTYNYSCIANENSVITRVPKKALLLNENGDVTKIKIINNMLRILSEKALYLNQKLLIANSVSIREKLAKFFLQQSKVDDRVELYFTREELADFLGVARPSVSRELMNIHKDGLIEVHKNSIKLNKEELEKLG